MLIVVKYIQLKETRPLNISTIEAADTENMAHTVLGPKVLVVMKNIPTLSEYETP